VKTFERLLPTEDADIQEIVAGILAAQANFAHAQNRPLGRGTHTKGTCVRGTFEIFDVKKTVADPILAGKLARGLYAQPGVYSAVIRFANAASNVQPDYKPDVRALSFAVTVPAGVVGPDATRLDFTMNNAPTFPINDAHAFAVLMRVLQAGGAWGAIKALTTMSPAEFGSLLATGWRGAQQKKNSVRPFETMRFWSNVPFRHGPDEAIKYSAIPSPTNPSQLPAKSDDMLRDDLIEQTNAGRSIAFDFGLQLLDADKMRYRGRPRDEIFWVENASVEWPETEAPFTTVGRLTVTPSAVVPPDSCEVQYIDVTEHSTPDSCPLGSINRARWYAESASRNARLGPLAPKGAEAGAAVPGTLPAAREGAPLPAPATARGTWLGRLTLRSLLRVTAFNLLALAGLITALSLATMTYLHFGGGMLPEERVDQVTYANQGWGVGVEAADRQTFYYTAQGAGLKDVRYSWFVNLEMPLGSRRLADPSVMRRYGFLVDDQTEHNPDQLPVGFTKHFDKTLNEELLDITCAACHTGQIQITRDGLTRALRIDGGQAGHAFTDSNFGNFVPTMLASMTSTAANPLKFSRFARRVLGPGYPEGMWTLHGQLRDVIYTFLGVAFAEKWHGLSPTREGYGRTDALARIANTVFAENLVSSNYAVGNGPVNYPSLWNIWKFDWVQYTASVSQPMARNIGESMGVGARYALMDRYGRPLPPEARFRSSSLIDGLHTIETTLQRLKPPAWPEDMLGKVNHEQAARGQKLFDDHCVHCHGPFVAPQGIKTRNAPGKTADQPEWLVRTVCVDDIGTDPNTAVNFAKAFVDISRTGLTAMDLRKVARRTMETWNERQAVYLKSEIERLRRLTDPESRAELAKDEKELAGLADQMEQQLSGIDPTHISVGAALSYLGTLIREKAYADGGYSEAEQAVLDGFGILDMPQVTPAYRPKPLAGMWATPPFLHNGSVPTIYDLLSPAAERPKTFKVGSREYDPEHLGLAVPKQGGFWTFDTSLPGNRNTGHEFGPGYDEKNGSHQVRKGLIGPPLSPDERLAIIEYLKIRDDDKDGPKTPKIPATPWCGLPAK
jgi:hypothetical protein